MPSAAYRRWRTIRAAALDDVEAARAAVGGSGHARHVLVQQVNRAYAVLLSAEFQGFCRDLYNDCRQAIAAAVPPALGLIILREFECKLALDRGNPNPGGIGSDFNRLGLEFWPTVTKADARAAAWRAALDRLNVWRNAIAHHDYDPVVKDGIIVLTAAEVRGWRRACARLARLFDRVMRSHLQAVTGLAPWS